MGDVQDLIDFTIIEEHKENIASLPCGRSAKALAQLYSPVSASSPVSTLSDAHASARLNFEQEISLIDESDDPLAIYDRYVRWTLDTYPTASATPQSQLLPLLERATKTFLKSDQYKNDARYLKIWLTYLQLFADAPRETFAYLARHDIGRGLALFYEEFAAWLEGAGSWTQAREVYQLGLDRDAAPVARLRRKHNEFLRRAEQHGVNVNEPCSPALPTVRPALASRTDPFSASSPPATDPQAASKTANTNNNMRKQKMQIFSDDGETQGSASAETRNGWESLGTIATRRKENIHVAQPWAGTTIAQGTKQNAGIPKMSIFKDQTLQSTSSRPIPSNHVAREDDVAPVRVGRVETVFVNLKLVYPNPSDPTEEYSFEELRAASRGWLNRSWSPSRTTRSLETKQRRPELPARESTTRLVPLADAHALDDENLAEHLVQSMSLQDKNIPQSDQRDLERQRAKRLRREERANRTRKIKAETQTVQTNLDSPKGPKIRRKKSVEPTMTLDTRAAMDEVYELFNHPMDEPEDQSDEEGSASDTESEDEDEDDEHYASAGESTTTTGHISGATSEYGEETARDLEDAKDDITDGADGLVLQDDTSSPESCSSGLAQGQEGMESCSSSGEQAADPTRGYTADARPEHEEVGDLTTPTSPEGGITVASRFIPVQPEDYTASTRPYRDASQAASHRLPFMPFMTPIVENTESSMGTTTTRRDEDYFNSKTPCPKADRKAVLPFGAEVWGSSPFQDVLEELPRHGVDATSPADSPSRPRATRHVSSAAKQEVILSQGPIIKDAQCNPMAAEVHGTILAELQPPITSYEGYFHHKDQISGCRGEIEKFCKLARTLKSGGEKSTASQTTPPVLVFKGRPQRYAIRAELGVGAYAPVFLAEQVEITEEDREDEARKEASVVSRSKLSAIKMEDPPSAWEFYILRTVHQRLGTSRPADSIVQAYAMHLFQDEGFLVEQYRDQGTLLNLVNIAGEQSRATGGQGGMDESLAMFFAIEILRTVEALHANGIIHGDLKADNVLVRLDSDADVSTQYRRNGSEGWSDKGITLIDFGRSIDMSSFVPGVQFIADWATTETDCAEMRELRPWTFQADYHGVAAIAHTMLFGKYIETVADRGPSVPGAAKHYKLREPLKRYWQTDIWGEFFALMLNPGRRVDAEEGSKLPVVGGMRSVREKMESWLEGNSQKGVGLRAWVKKLEGSGGSRRKT